MLQGGKLVQFGRITIPIVQTANTFTTVSITFPVAFTSADVILVAGYNLGISTATFCNISAESVTALGCKIIVSTGLANPNALFSWVAYSFS